MKKLLPLLLIGATTACATKGDLRDLQTVIRQSQARTDSSLAVLARQNRAVLDSLEATNERLVRMRGDLGNQLLSIEQSLVQVQELTGQSQRRIAELREQIGERMQQMQQPATSGQDAGAPAGGSAGQATGDVADLFEIGRTNLERGAAGTARRAFEDIVRNHPNDALAPEAQLGIAETYVAEQQSQPAFAAFDRVVELYPSSDAAPRALYRAGVVATEAGDAARARDYFNRVVRGYPNSDAARMASEQLRRGRG